MIVDDKLRSPKRRCKLTQQFKRKNYKLKEQEQIFLCSKYKALRKVT